MKQMQYIVLSSVYYFQYFSAMSCSRNLQNSYLTMVSQTLRLYNVVPGTPSLGVKRPECEANHSPPSSAEVKE
jgi:hypothetical protein